MFAKRTNAGRMIMATIVTKYYFSETASLRSPSHVIESMQKDVDRSRFMHEDMRHIVWMRRALQS